MRLKIFLNLFFLLISSAIFSQEAKIDSLVNKLHKEQNDSLKTEICSYIAFLHLYSNDHSKADYYIEKTKTYALHANFTSGLGFYYNLKGFQSYKKHKFQEALEYYHLAEEKFQNSSSPTGKASFHTNIGVLLDILGKQHDALAHFQKAHSYILLKNNSKHLSNSFKNIASTHFKLGNYKNAEDYCQQAIIIAQKNNLQYTLAASLLIMANIHKQSEKFDDAKQEYLNALTIFNEINHLKGIASCELNMGNLYVQEKKYDLALTYSKRALEKFEKLNDKIYTAFCLNTLGVILLRQSKGNEAISYFKQSLIKQKEFGSQKQIATIYKNISDTYSLTNNYEQAFLNLKKYLALHDSIYHEEKYKTIAELEAKYKAVQNKTTIERQNAEISRKESERKLLLVFVASMVIAFAIATWAFFQKRKSNIKIERQRAEISEKNKLLEVQKHDLQVSNTTKDKMFSIIAHDLRGPVGSLKSFVDILAENNRILETSKGEKYLKSFQNSANSTFTLLDNLLFWAKNQQGTMDFVPTEQNIKDIIEENYELLLPIAKQKEIEFLMPNASDQNIYFDKIMIGIVVRNLMANALKFTPTNGKVEVTTKIISNEILITIKDNGVGISLENQDIIFNDKIHYSTKGTVNEKGSGLGLVLCKEFVTKNSGRIWFNSFPNRGSEFCFTLPLKNPTKEADKKQHQHNG